MFTQNGINFLNLCYIIGGTSAYLTFTAKNYAGSDVTVQIEPSAGNWFFAPALMADTQQARTSGAIGMISNNTKVFFNSSSTTTHPQYYGVIIGDGDTIPTVSDYALSGNQITDFSATSALTRTTTNGKLTLAATYNITNTSAASFTIKEIGVTRSAANSSPARILIMRDLLATPVTIAPGDTGVVTYKIEIS